MKRRKEHPSLWVKALNRPGSIRFPRDDYGRPGTSSTDGIHHLDWSIPLTRWFVLVIVLETIGAIVFLLNAQSPVEAGKYVEHHSAPFFPAFGCFLGAYVITILVFMGIYVRLSGSVFEAIDNIFWSLLDGEFTEGVGKNLGTIFCTCTIGLAVALSVWIGQSIYLSSELEEHNTAITIEKLNTVYSSAEKLDKYASIIEQVKDKNKVDEADPYLVKDENGDSYVLYVSIDAEEQRAEVMTKTRVDGNDPVEIIE